MSARFELWAKGRGVVQHQEVTRQRVLGLIQKLEAEGVCTSERAVALLRAADSLCNMAMWLTVHMTYAKNVYLDGRALAAEDFKTSPEGHTGGALNMVPAYVGYLLANALSGNTRAWMMGQGHCVAAIDAANILIGNLELEQAERYPLSDQGLSRLCQDFYSYEIAADGRPAAPLGSHVNPYTAGGISEGGYLGFAELQYMHMPLPGQQLVTFLSDGAFEEQRGSDWAPRWWRGEDTGLVMPIMIANGRRIDQRSTMAQTGGVQWFRDHLKLNGFAPVDIDGRDPAAFAWAIINMADNLKQKHESLQQGLLHYPLELPYAIAETTKGYGFFGAGTNAAHNLPLIGNPSSQEDIRALFNQGAQQLYVPLEELQAGVALLNNHHECGRRAEKAHCLREFKVSAPQLPEDTEAAVGQVVSPMEQLDRWFCALVQANPGHRFRVGNPDEMRSNRMNKSLDALLHRVAAPEAGIAESLFGSVITALNEEAVVSAALANKQGINLAVSYEAFAVKMLGAMRQEAIFARHFIETGRRVEWLSVPIIVTSHTWENGKNEQSHQDPTLSEAWIQEMADVAPVVFPFDANTAVAVLAKLYAERGRVATAVIAKGKVEVVCSKAQAKLAAEQGALLLSHDTDAQIQLIAIGAYQLQAVLRAAVRLREKGIRCSVVAMLEPGRFRGARDELESVYAHTAEAIETIIPRVPHRVIVCHTHAEVMAGVLRRLDTGPQDTRFMGYRNRGGTLDVFGMQFANQQTWAHIVQESCDVLAKTALDTVLTMDEMGAIAGKGKVNVLR